MANRRSRRLDLDAKKKILEDLDSHRYTQIQLSQIYGTSKSTIASIQSNRKKLLEKFEQSHREDVDFIESKLLDWLAKCRLSKTSVSASSVMEKARAFGQELRVDFHANLQWLKEFQKRCAVDGAGWELDSSQRGTESTGQCMVSVRNIFLRKLWRHNLSVSNI